MKAVFLGFPMPVFDDPDLAAFEKKFAGKVVEVLPSKSGKLFSIGGKAGRVFKVLTGDKLELWAESLDFEAAA